MGNLSSLGLREMEQRSFVSTAHANLYRGTEPASGPLVLAVTMSASPHPSASKPSGITVSTEMQPLDSPIRDEYLKPCSDAVKVAWSKARDGLRLQMWQGRGDGNISSSTGQSEADFETHAEEQRRFAILNVPRHLFSEATGEAARRAAKKKDR
jgi:hypothetical protein